MLIKSILLFMLLMTSVLKAHAQGNFILRGIFAGPFILSEINSQNDLSIQGFSRELRLDVGTKFDEILSLGVSIGRITTDYEYDSSSRGKRDYHSNFNSFMGWFALNFATPYYFLFVEPLVRIGYGSFLFSGEGASDKSVPSFVMGTELNFKMPLIVGTFIFGTGVRKFLPKKFNFDSETFKYTDFSSEFYHSIGIEFLF